MRKSILLGVLGLLALSLVPVSGHAQMPGEKCELERLGTTKRADDDQNIIACLKTGDTTPGANVTEWKAMTSSGGGGITGGCGIYGPYVSGNNYMGDINGKWGKGCRAFDKPDNSRKRNGSIYWPDPVFLLDHCAEVASAPGYECGAVVHYQESSSTYSSQCVCTEK